MIDHSKECHNCAVNLPCPEAKLEALEAKVVALRVAVSKWLMPTSDGSVEGYGGPHPKGDPWDHNSWSDGHDYQHAALDIWNYVNQICDKGGTHEGKSTHLGFFCQKCGEEI